MGKEAGVPMVEPVSELPTVIQVAGNIGIQECLPLFDRQDLAGKVRKKRRNPLDRRLLPDRRLGRGDLVSSQFHAQPRPCPDPGIADHKRKREYPRSSVVTTPAPNNDIGHSQASATVSLPVDASPVNSSLDDAGT